MKQLINVQHTGEFDVNDSGSETADLNVEEANLVNIYVSADSGSNSTFTLEVYGAGTNEDGTAGDYFLIPDTDIIQLQQIAVDMGAFSFMKVAVKTVEGSAGTVNILINTYYTLKAT